MTDHIADRAGFLAALSNEDLERKTADEHARSCFDCRTALEEGGRLVALLRQALPLPPDGVSQPTRLDAAQVERAIRQEASRRLTWISVGAVGLAWLFQLMVGGGFHLELDCLVVSLAVMAVAIASVTLLRGRERLAVATVIVASALVAYLSGTASGFDPGIGIRCTFRELWAAGITWAIVVTAGRSMGIKLSRWNLTAVAAAGALAAHAGQHLACAVPHSDAHLLVFHFGGVVLATLLGAAGARRVSAALAA